MQGDESQRGEDYPTSIFVTYGTEFFSSFANFLISPDDENVNSTSSANRIVADLADFIVFGYNQLTAVISAYGISNIVECGIGYLL